MLVFVWCLIELVFGVCVCGVFLFELVFEFL